VLIDEPIDKKNTNFFSWSILLKKNNNNNRYSPKNLTISVVYCRFQWDVYTLSLSIITKKRQFIYLEKIK
jgi:hypothetical protein